MKKKQRIRLLIANTLHIFGISVLAPVYALYGLKIGANAWQIGFSWGIYSMVAGISTILLGRLIDGVKRDKNFLVTGYIISIVGIALFFFVQDPTQLYAVMAINAIGVGFYMPSWKALYTKSENRDKIASQWGMFDGINMIAMAGAALTAGYLVNIGKYNIMFGLIIALYSIATIVALTLGEK